MPILPFLFAGTQDQLALAPLVARDYRVVPDGKRPHTVILQHDNRISGRNLTQQVFEAWRELVRHHAVTPRCGQHFDLQTALPGGEIDTVDEIFRRNLYIEMRECRRQCGRAALVIFLRKERDPADFDVLRQSGGPGVVQIGRLRHHQRAATQLYGKNKNARGQAGAFA